MPSLKRDCAAAMAADPVCSASDLQEAVRIERGRGARTLYDSLSLGCIHAYRLMANLLLAVLGQVWFARIVETPKSIIVYTVGTLGDNVLMMPAVAAIRRRFPDAKLKVVANCDGFSSYPAVQIWGNNPLVDQLVILHGHPVQRQGLGIRIDAPGLENSDCDLFINLSPFGNRGWLGAVVREMIFARFLGAQHAIGFRVNSYNRKGKFNRVQHYFVKNEARRPKDVLKILEIEPVENCDLLVHDETAKSCVEHLLHDIGVKADKLVVLNPGSKLAASQWPAHRFGEFASWLTESEGASVVVNGTEDERVICEEVVRSSGGKATCLAGRLSIRELIELLRISSACISNNTGTMTLAAMTGIPLIVLASTRFSPCFYMPLSGKMIWLFSFSEASYSYSDMGGTSKDLLNIEVCHLIDAYRTLKERSVKE